jgi:hypothetical protein
MKKEDIRKIFEQATVRPMGVDHHPVGSAVADAVSNKRRRSATYTATRREIVGSWPIISV